MTEQQLNSLPISKQSIKPGIHDEPMDDLGLPLRRLGSHGVPDAMIVAEELSKEKQKLSAYHLVSVHVADVLEFRLAGLVN